jgi:hypothetical protein
MNTFVHLQYLRYENSCTGNQDTHYVFNKTFMKIVTFKRNGGEMC